MASVDDPCYQQTDPDTVITNLCEPCNYDSIQKQATHLCDDCQELFCGKCTEFHKRQKMTRSHKILPLQDVKRQVATRLDASCCVTCDCSQSLEVTEFCKKHNDVFCRNCKTVIHYKCKTSSLGEIDSSYTKANLESLQQRADMIKAKTDALLKEKSDEMQTFDKIKLTCKNEIKTFRKKHNQVLDNLEAGILRELENLKSQERLEIERLISSYSAATQVLETDLKLLDEVKTDSKKTSMFAANIKISKHLQKYERLSQDVSLSLGNELSSVSFQPNDHLRDLHTNIKELGTLTVNKTQQHQSDRKLFPELKTELSYQICIDSTSIPSISGCGIFPDGRIVLCDQANPKLILFSKSFKLEDTLTLASESYDVAIINDKKAIITIPNKQRLQFIEVSPTMTTGMVIPLDKECYGVAVGGDEIYTSCCWLDAGEVRIFDLDGHFKRKVGVDQNGRPNMFCSPYYIRVNDQSGKIFISDVENETLTCLRSDGKVIYKYKAIDMKCPRGISVDRKDNVMICDEDSCNVFVVNKDGERKNSLITSKDGIRKPRCVAYGAKDGTLIVGCRDIKNLFVVKTE